MKPILDATAGNRTIYKNKPPEHTVFMDKEYGLAVPPDVFATWQYLPFRDDVFETVIFDPPHYWGNLPAFLIPRDYNKGILSSGINRATGLPRKATHNFTFTGKFRSWERAYIPGPVSRALGVAVRNALEMNPTAEIEAVIHE